MLEKIQTFARGSSVFLFYTSKMTKMQAIFHVLTIRQRFLTKNQVPPWKFESTIFWEPAVEFNEVRRVSRKLTIIFRRRV
jgi:hypothetical protein